MKINFILIAVAIVAILGFVYFIIKRNKKDQKELEKELNQKELKPEKHDSEHI
jgi:preprotein translocase subunit YajC